MEKLGPSSTSLPAEGTFFELVWAKPVGPEQSLQTANGRPAFSPLTTSGIDFISEIRLELMSASAANRCLGQAKLTEVRDAHNSL
jgi:hypothetical protein